MRKLSQIVILATLGLSLSACGKGGSLDLEPETVAPTKSKGSPFVTVNQGGKALIVEQGKTASTGVHGYVTIQAVTARTLANTGGTVNAVVNMQQAQSVLAK